MMAGLGIKTYFIIGLVYYVIPSIIICGVIEFFDICGVM